MKMFADSVPIALRPKVPYLKITADKIKQRGVLFMDFLLDGIMSVTWQQCVMYLVGILLIWLAIKKGCEPTLLLPMGFGAILVNLPLSGVLNQVMSGVGETHGIIEWLFEICI